MERAAGAVVTLEARPSWSRAASAPKVVLAVDDDPLTLALIAATFEDSDLKVRFARSGAEALALLAQLDQAPELMIVDRLMPVVDGMTVLRCVKSNPQWAAMPVVMQTAEATPAQIEEGLRAGAYYYLTKPYSPDALQAIVSAALESGRARTSREGGDATVGLRAMQRGTFSIRTLEEVEALAELLAGLCPDPGAAWTGLRELLANAVEHGNLAISYAEKTQLKRDDRWREEVERRLRLPEYADRRVEVTFERSRTQLRFVITDEGGGFAWRNYLSFDAERAFDPNGRGIALARAMCFHDLHYENNGNRAVACLELGPKRT